MSYLFQEVHKEGDEEAGNYIPNKNTYIAFFNRLLQCFYSSFLRGNIIHMLWTTIESCARIVIYYFSTQGILSFGFVFGIESVSISIRIVFVGFSLVYISIFNIKLMNNIIIFLSKKTRPMNK